jgi:hypothetical protein
MAGRHEIGRKCPYCGAMVSYDEYFCRACHRKFEDVSALDAPSEHKPEEYIVSLPKTGISLLLSVFGVGLGQFYNGDTLKGIAFFIAFILVSFDYVRRHTMPSSSLASGSLRSLKRSGPAAVSTAASGRLAGRVISCMQSWRCLALLPCSM